MLNFLIAFAIVLLSFGSVYAADPVTDFERLVKRASEETNRVSPVYFADRMGKWLKTFRDLSDVKYDVKKTDSLITPVVGEVSFLVVSKKSRPFATKADASKATEVDDSIPPTSERVALRYTWKGGAWRLIGGEEAISFGGVLASQGASVIKVVREELVHPELVLYPWYK